VTNGNRIGWDSLDAVRRLTASYVSRPQSKKMTLNAQKRYV